MGGPSNAERGLVAEYLTDPAFLAWAKQKGKLINRVTPARELTEMLAQYQYEIQEKRRIDEAKIHNFATQAMRARALAKPVDGLVPMFPTQQIDEDADLKYKIKEVWKRYRREDLQKNAEYHVKNAIANSKYLFSGHLSDEKDRWLYIRYYFIAMYKGEFGSVPDELKTLEHVVTVEKKYLAETEKRSRPIRQLQALRQWASRQPMNPLDNFEPGIAYYDLGTASEQPFWVDRDISCINQDGYTTTISYSNGKSLQFSAKSLDFKGKYQASIVQLFARRHKASRRLVPFALYDMSVDLYADLPPLDELSAEDRVLMALPYMYTAAVQEYYSRDPLIQVAEGLLDVLKLMSIQKFLPLGAPTLSSAATATVQGTTRFATGSIGLTRAAAAEVTFAVRTYGFTAQAATHVGRSAYTYYLSNAVSLNIGVVMGTELVFSMAGYDMGPVSPGDTLSVAAQMDDAAKVAIKAVSFDRPVPIPNSADTVGKVWKKITLEVAQVEAKAEKATVRVLAVESISDDVAKAEYDFGKKVAGEKKVINAKTRGVTNPTTNTRATTTATAATPKSLKTTGTKPATTVAKAAVAKRVPKTPVKPNITPAAVNPASVKNVKAAPKPPRINDPHNMRPDATNFDRQTAGSGGIDEISFVKDPDGRYAVKIKGTLLDSLYRGKGKAPVGKIKAPNYNRSRKFVSNREAGLDSEWENAHLWGPGFGDEAAAGMMKAPKKMNQWYQNEGIEGWMRDLRKIADKEKGTVEVEATAIAWDLSKQKWQPKMQVDFLKRVEYRIQLKLPNRPTQSLRVTIDVAAPPGASVVLNIDPPGAVNLGSLFPVPKQP